LSRPFASAEEIAAQIADGALVALPADYAGGAMTVVRELVRRNARRLRLLGVPQLGLAADILVGAGCVAEVETAAFTLGEHGLPPCFQRAYRAGTLTIRDSTCPAIHSALQAAEKGLPFLPVRGIIGSDLLKIRPDWKVVDNPFPPHDPIVVVPSIGPDVALFHASAVDIHGNLFVGVRRELMVMAHASAATFATVERIQDGSLLRDQHQAAGTIPAIYVSAIAQASRGSAPLCLWGKYPADDEGLATYAARAATAQGFAQFLDEWLNR
jgi:glutaconate CoA-transferase, subunit A